MRKQSYPIASIALFVALLFTVACGRKADDGTIRLNGRVEAPQVDLASKVPGRVTEVYVREGQRVKAGQLLARLDLGETATAVERERAGARSAEERALDVEAGSRAPEIAAARAEVNDRQAASALAQKELDRQQFLLGRTAGTQREVDRARADAERARAALRISEERLRLATEGARTHQKRAAQAEADRAKAALEQTVIVARESEIVAPADGIIVHRFAEPGQLVAPSQPAFTLAFTDRLYVRTFIPETKLGRVKMGMPGSVEVDAFPGRTFAARITEISPEAEFTPKVVETEEERVNLVYAAKADLERGWNEPLVPGQPAVVIVKAGAGK
jgi:HlyD family secretion protein